MSFPKPFHPEIMYAERSSETEPEKNIIYFTINVPDIQGEPNLDLTPHQISFSARSGNPDKGLPEKEWAFDLDFWGEIVPKETKKIVTSRAVVLILRKKELRAEYWPRLTKEKPNRSGWIKTDFSKWVDEDEQDGEEPDMPDMGDMGGMGGMPGMGGMGGMGGMDMSQLMAGMGGGMGGAAGGMPGMPGMGGAGGMDFAKMMEQMGAAGGMPGDDEGDDAEGDKPAAKKEGEPEVEVVEEVE